MTSFFFPISPLPASALPARRSVLWTLTVIYWRIGRQHAQQSIHTRSGFPLVTFTFFLPQCTDHPTQSLDRLVLTGNRIASISVPQQNDHLLPKLKSLFLSLNELNTWDSIDALSLWCPALETLTISGNPLAEGRPYTIFGSLYEVSINPSGADGQHYRQFIVAKLPSLRVLDATQVGFRILFLSRNTGHRIYI
jgi:Leucine-rich repeat (LRR) protein